MSLTRSLDKAREAYKKKDIQATIKVHSVKEEHKQEQGKYIKSAVYGGLDGIITTFAVVAGVAGARLSTAVVIILGFANLVGDGLSMAIGDYLSTKSEQEFKKAERKREEWEVENYPEGEKKELIELYTEKGLSKKDSEKIVDIISKDKKAWVDIMMVEELNMVEEDESPVKNSLVTFFSFALFGFIPLLTYLTSQLIPSLRFNDFIIATILTALTLFVLGALKVFFTGKNWFKSGSEMLVVGGIAASAAYLIGFLLGGLA